jgi:hypothetical protein
MRNSDAPLQWLVLGILTADNKFIRRPGLTAPRTAPATLDPRSPLRAEFFGPDGRLLLRAGIPVTTPCSDGPGADPPFRIVSGTVPLPAETTLVRFMLDDVLLEEYKAPDGEPRTRLHILGEPQAGGALKIAWASEHPQGAPLTHIVGFSNDDGATWEPVGLPTSANESIIDLETLPGGKRCRVSVKTTDGLHTVLAVSEPFDVPVKPCAAMILAPESGFQIRFGAPLELRGQGFWREERRPELEALQWSSSRAGFLGRGPYLAVNGLVAGEHEITLVAGEGERAGRTSIVVTVG